MTSDLKTNQAIKWSFFFTRLEVLFGQIPEATLDSGVLCEGHTWLATLSVSGLRRGDRRLGEPKE